ncbi:glucoamylase [Drechmeria coniospora]|uniref:Glucoamylase n=1 Tax=Drechmeria coniospora TaxID=98403 RepID=A0A151GIU5_DRECN|nr:glucoamylase [Drechmeria coniospora]KYK56961.1 glucoamylase [Drechmeria coniospora]
MLSPADIPLPPDDDSLSPLSTHLLTAGSSGSASPSSQFQPSSIADSSRNNRSSTELTSGSGGETGNNAAGGNNNNLNNLNNNNNKARESTVPAACLSCRSKHLKCDGQNPCSRCVLMQAECVYVASRRGYKGPRRGTTQNPNKRQATSPPEVGGNVTECPMLLGTRPGGDMPLAVDGGFSQPTPMSGGTPAPENSYPAATSTATNMQLFKSYCSVNGVDPASFPMGQQAGCVPSFVPVKSLSERCIDAFYHYFFASHPFVLPRAHLMRISKDGAPEPLLAAMRWTGSVFIDVGPAVQKGLYDEAYRLVYDPRTMRNGFLVQAMMILIVTLDGSCQQEQARHLLNDVEQLALEINLHTRSFAMLHGQGMPVLEECWRRTWWDLFIIDAMIAGVHRVTHFLLFDIPTDVALPCEEHQYLSANIPIPLSLEDLEDRDFSDEGREFSSFAYRILCGRNLGKFMRTPPILGPEDENLARIEALLTNWRLHLPQDKRDALQRDGKLDEMMFQAHMMMHATSILLHQPHSQLDTTPTQNINSCAPHQMVPAGDLFNTHTKHTITSASAISTMITHRVPLLSHTHFFTCVITLSSIVHLSRWALFFIPHDDDDLRQQVRLNIGALNRLAEVWGAADRARGQVKAVAQEIYQAKKQQRLNSEFWVGLKQDEMMNTIAMDDSIIHEIESLQVPPNLLS